MAWRSQPRKGAADRYDRRIEVRGGAGVARCRGRRRDTASRALQWNIYSRGVAGSHASPRAVAVKFLPVDWKLGHPRHWL